ncbi:MAG: hypothetical protein AMJ53_03470 [Gammaproteobacteria bacterium SG8_11]|nr:MAG: hypothetical protein AMJ53_03470 [Gammaproteobacteria bacterium SG8_11]
MKFWKSKRRSTVVGERRLDTRKPSTIQAAMCWEQSNTRQCRITSISLTGMFLELNAAKLKIGTLLELFFYCRMDDSKKLCSEWVRVVGQRQNGIAVSFARFDNLHQSNMQLMLQQAFSDTRSPSGAKQTEHITANMQKTA